MDRETPFAQFNFFSEISREQLMEIQSFSIVQTYEKGELVFRRNEPAKNFYCLVRGEVDLTILFREEIITKDIKYEEYIRTRVELFEKPVIIEKIGAGEVFGWSSLVSPGKMTASAQCAGECEIILIPAAELQRRFSHDSELGYQLTSKLSKIMAKRLNSRTQKLVDAWCSSFDIGRIQ